MKIENIEKVKNLIERLEKFRALRENLLGFKKNNIEVCLFKQGKNGITFSKEDSGFNNEIYLHLIEMVNVKIENLEEEIEKK